MTPGLLYKILHISKSIKSVAYINNSIIECSSLSGATKSGSYATFCRHCRIWRSLISYTFQRLCVRDSAGNAEQTYKFTRARPATSCKSQSLLYVNINYERFDIVHVLPHICKASHFALLSITLE